MPVDDPILALVGQPDSPLADAAVWRLTVSTVTPITSDYRRVVFAHPGLERFSFQPG